ncbi:hypothetical protein LCGC14_0974950 [marine sediment metagenome]|uniref:Uncharacterized protein n=1 Tax=marine sediment metagenome TaxID=412755 RepID=A0A0F9NF01_9ZZZZ
MTKIRIPLPFDDLDTHPPLASMITISDDMLQALVLLSGYSGTERKLLRCTPTGILNTVTPRFQGIINVAASGANYLYQGPVIMTTEVMVRSNPNNAGLVWVNIDGAATTDTGWPLASGEVLMFTVDNLNHVHLKIIADTEKVILMYSR